MGRTPQLVVGKWSDRGAVIQKLADYGLTAPDEIERILDRCQRKGAALGRPLRMTNSCLWLKPKALKLRNSTWDRTRIEQIEQIRADKMAENLFKSAQSAQSAFYLHDSTAKSPTSV
ncbi:MAG: hypothetical protein R2873_24780 [Caldilineaceae bacterium]